MPKSSYIELRAALHDYLSECISVPVQLHSGSFSQYELENLHLLEGDQCLMALNSLDENSARFSLFFKLGNDSQYSADTKGLGLLQQAQMELGRWKHSMIAKRIKSQWRLLADNTLAQHNCYVYQLETTVPIYLEDYMEDYMEEYDEY